uniref:Secreted protein n=1 Tax=Heterorhabditis bacteriophora TaxID=37862 RepID=A0A1I7WZB1_HETBA
MEAWKAVTSSKFGLILFFFNSSLLLIIYTHTLHGRAARRATIVVQNIYSVIVLTVNPGVQRKLNNPILFISSNMFQRTRVLFILVFNRRV